MICGWIFPAPSRWRGSAREWNGCDKVNQTTQNIGARRLYTILERLLEELSYEAPEMKMGKVQVNAAYVESRLDEISKDEDLSKYIL